MKMSKIKLSILIGILTIILPYLGFPYFVKNILFLVFGVTIIVISCQLSRTLKNETEKENEQIDNFSENDDFESK